MDITILNDTSVNNHHGCQIVMDNLVCALKKNGARVIHTVPCRDDWTDTGHRKHIEASDRILVNAEGSTHSGRPFAEALLRVSAFCKERGIPCDFINGVYQDNSESMHRSMRDFSKRFVREGYSKSTLQALDIESEVVPDLTLGTPLYRPELLDFDRGGDRQKPPSFSFLFTDSVNTGTSMQLYRMRAQLPGSIYMTLRHSPKFLSLKKRLFDILFRKKFRCDLIKGRGENSYTDNIFDLFEIISCSDFVVTGRFHMMCFCVLLNKPFLVFNSNSHKVAGMLADMGLTDQCLASITDLDSEFILARKRSWREEHSVKLKQYREKSARKIDGMIASIISSNSEIA